MAPAQLRVAVLDDFEGAMARHPALDNVRERAAITVFDTPLGERAAATLTDFDAVCLIRERTAFPAALIDQLSALKYIAFTGARNPSCDQAAAAAKGIAVSNTPGGPAKASTAEQTWALMLAASKQMVAAESGMRAGNWRSDTTGRQYPLPSMLEGEQLGLVGVGEIGSRVAAVGKAFGMQVVGWSPNLTSQRAAAAGVEMVGKEELFRTSRFVSLHLVLSDRTRGIVSAADLESMRADSVLVNTSRAGLIDMPALLKGLQAGAPAHAALDVYPAEPIPLEDPAATILSMPNVTLSPHLGYVTEKVFDAFATGLAEVIDSWIAGQPVRVINN